VGIVRVVIAFVAFLCLVGGIALHLSTFADVPSEVVWGLAKILHCAVLATVILALGVNKLTGSAERPVCGALTVVPAAVGIAYCLVHVVLGWTVLERAPYGGPSGDAGAYYLHSHGRKLRDLTDAEYHRAVILNTRDHAAFLVLFAGAGLSIARHMLSTARCARQMAEPHAAPDRCEMRYH
jgi:hypothetical protein